MNHSSTQFRALTVAGFDPSGGAGVLADVKTFEASGVYGFGVVTALTVQNDCEFDSVEWTETGLILRQIEALLRRFPIRHIKIGLIRDLETLREVLDFLHRNIAKPVIVLDPILAASAGFQFHDTLSLPELVRDVSVITPNIPEAEKLLGPDELDGKLLALSHSVTVYLKGGHAIGDTVTDVLYNAGRRTELHAARLEGAGKHGSGCVLSSALTSALARGLGSEAAAQYAFQYTGGFLSSASGLLGLHYSPERKTAVYEEN
jgi:hydroxymethylpyrimidine/phosphomethylpyrimidine kinase